MEQIGFEHDGLDIITMQDFLKEEAMTGNLRNITSGKVAFPPGNRTNWDGMDPKELKEYLRDVTLTPLDWKPELCLAAFPSDDGPEHFEELNNMMSVANKEGLTWKKFEDKPVDVDAAPLDRLLEASAGFQKKLCIYDAEMQAAPVVHFMCYHKMRVRMLTHFYAFLFFEDWRQDLWGKRFVRDHLRYSDEIQCAAARVVAAVRKRARERIPWTTQRETLIPSIFVVAIFNTIIPDWKRIRFMRMRRMRFQTKRQCLLPRIIRVNLFSNR